MLIDRRPPKPVWFMPDNPRPKLKCALVPVFRVHVSDLDAYIEKVFGFDFDVLHATGCGPGACPEFLVTGTYENDGMKRQAMQLKTGQRTRSVKLILNTLAAEGYIHCGKYIVDTKPLIDVTEAYRSMLESGLAPDDERCMKFKEAHKGNRVFAERAVILDDAAYEERLRGKR
jgi:hypothetical protein